MTPTRPLFLALWLVMTAITGHSATIRVFAASSVADALKEITAAYQNESGDKIAFNFAGSNVLARQIEEGAPADVFVSADEIRMDQLEKAGRIASETRTNLLGNSLVVITARDSRLRIPTIAELSSNTVKRIAVADPKAVPAGVYARNHLTKLGLWSAVEPKMVPTDDARAALAAVESGNIEVGIVYKTDAALSQKVQVALEIPASSGPSIRYPVAMLKDAKESNAAIRFLLHLQSDAAAKVFRKHGFLVLP